MIRILKTQLTYDEFYGWIADSYLAVFINDNGEFRNDQSIFDGEYPVFDKTIKAWWPSTWATSMVMAMHDMVFHITGITANITINRESKCL